MKVPVMRTLGPIHLEDLEPHRFEDLVRQLLYDFRPWRALEVTGRSGGDDGFDARGREVVSSDPQEAGGEPSEEDDEGGDPTGIEERIWLIQCKREKSIGPTKAREYMVGLAAACTPAAPYGLVFVADCDLSKKTRDAIWDEARKLGFMEIHVWAKGEIEDQLFQPKNDHLLFAYTGISLQIRRRSFRTEVRAKLAAKRKLLRVLKDAQLVLVLEASDSRFPFPDGFEGGHWSRRRHWNVFYAGHCGWDGFHLILKRCWAAYDPATAEWDVVETVNSGRPGKNADPWHEPSENIDSSSEPWEFWSKLGYNQALYVEEVVLPYENVIDVEIKTDRFFDGPTIHVDDFHPVNGPFLPGIYTHLEPVVRFAGWSDSHPDPQLRKKLFPEQEPGPPTREQPMPVPDE